MHTDPPQNPNHHLVQQLKESVFGKLPISVILFAASFVQGRFEERIGRAVDYLHEVIRTGNQASKTLFGITADLIQEGDIYELFGGEMPDMDELGAVMAQCLEGLLGAIEAGAFTRPEIVELMEHISQLAHVVMLPESDRPHEHGQVKIAISVLAKMRAAIAEAGEGEGRRKGLPDSLTAYLDVALNEGSDALKAGHDPVIPFVMTWETAGEPSVRRCLSDEYERGVQMARDHVAQKGGDTAAYCIVWSGYVTLEGQRTDALLIEAAERDSEKAVLMALCYRPAKGEAPFEEIGAVRLLEHSDNLLG